MIKIKIISMDGKYITGWVEENVEFDAVIEDINEDYLGASYLVDGEIDGETVKVVKLDESKKSEIIAQQELDKQTQSRIDEIQQRMNAIEQDISQHERYEIQNNIEELKREFITLYIEICELKNKTPKIIKGE